MLFHTVLRHDRASVAIVLGGEQTAVSGQRFRGNPLGGIAGEGVLFAGTDEAGHAFQLEAGRVFQSEAGHPWRQSHGSI